MADVTVKKVSEIGFYEGPGAREGITFRHAGADLGVESLGLNILELAAGCTAYPEHDHAGDGQEEVYVVLSGSGTLIAGGVEYALEAGTIARVAAGVQRRWTTSEGVTIAAMGGTPGKAYEPRR
jgi:mannose-6-phosphate isomerase-like protein (cupin superfamily)